VKVGFITRLRENPPERSGGGVGEKKLPRWQLQRDPQPLTGSTGMFSFCSKFVKTNRERRGQKQTAMPGGTAVVASQAGRG
jgi:hypothetical protein